MARIRTIKPDFFRHEGLQDLAKKHGFEVMLVFIGIWTQCDKRGCFLWSPRQLSLDILPFLKVDMKKMLDVLGQSKYVLRYTVDGKDYGFIPTFQKHQMIFGSERKYPAKFPEFCGITEDVLGSPKVDLGHRINGTMDKGNNGLMEKAESASLPRDPLFLNLEFCEAWGKWEEFRKGMKPKLTDHAKALNFAEVKKLAGEDPVIALEIINQTLRNGWKGFFKLKGDFNGKSNHAGIDGRRIIKNTREFPEALAL